ncbi:MULTISPECIES: ArsC family reductase [Brucella/Ochrobactrum group]|uniref:ArsC family reductase n=1 Tax=Brucella/Ochrobactrum group TaxID=2826938 RepID=UPI00165602D1|nr:MULTISPECIES: ArsC family reductase [Brucella/Ochrobactrum group]MBC8718030.1 ArsC family reductase [Ochrobactrum sp. Marseille-Q0166]
MSVTIYGIKACDTMKKARSWLEDHDIDYAFHDYKKDGLDAATIDRFLKTIEWEKLLNRAGTTFRKLPEEERQNVDAAKARALMLAQPSMVKRPVLDKDGKLTVGFKPDQYEEFFKA